MIIHTLTRCKILQGMDINQSYLVTVQRFCREFEPEAFPSPQSVYGAIREVPDFPGVKIGRKVFIDLERWRVFKASGGQGLAGGWRKKPSDSGAA